MIEFTLTAYPDVTQSIHNMTCTLAAYPDVTQSIHIMTCTLTACPGVTKSKRSHYVCTLAEPRVSQNLKAS